MTVRRAVRTVLIFGVAATLTGCASFTGSAGPISQRSARLDAVKALPEAEALRKFYSPNNSDRGGLDPASYRNYVSAVYEGAADAQYQAFRTQLSREIKGSQFGSTVAVLLMNGAAIVSGAEAARALAAASAVTTGTQGSFSKDVVYEKTLQALFAAMDGRRTSAKIRLKAGRQQSADRYSLREAFDDIADLERQASLDVAVEQLTALATTDAAAKETVLKSLYQAPILTEPQATRLASIVDFVDSLAANPTPANVAVLNGIAGVAKVTVADTPAKTRNNIVFWLNAPEQTGDLAAVVTKLKPVTNKDSY